MSAAPAPVHVGAHRRIVVVADTHGHPHAATHDRLAELGPTLLLHAGDIGDPAVLDDLATAAPLWAVRGNIDGHRLPDARVLDVDGPRGTLRIYLTHIALRGPRVLPQVAQAAHAAGAGLLVCGHSHVPFIGRDKGLVAFNPGSIGPRRFTLPIVLGVIDLDEGGVRLRHVSVETGQDWLPG